MEYEGLIVQQLDGGPSLVMFAAPVVDIAMWAGIPQMKRLGEGADVTETAGFQREEKESRVNDIAAFMLEPSNVIQNPLLAAVQVASDVEVDNESGHCLVRIAPPDLKTLSLRDLLRLAMKGLERRIPELVDRAVNQSVVQRLRNTLAVQVDGEEGTGGGDSEVIDMAVVPDEEVATAVSLSLFEEESQVHDFYDELKARLFVVEEVDDDEDRRETIGGFGRDFLESLVMPVVLVDGQHRLRGALKALENLESSDAGVERLAELIDGGLNPVDARLTYGRECGRTLPVSLLLSDEPAEHVFQFVVVNQKATPMSSALLGTIVSTSLTQDELDPIRLRLKSAGIELEGSRAIASLSRSPESPFRGLVATGVSGDQTRALPWSVFGKLIDVARNLEGGSPYHPPLVDYAKLWREGAFKRSELVDVNLSDVERRQAWSELNGPWRMFFIKLHTGIRDRFGEVEDPRTDNYWGSVRSNLFNLVSLHILTADFFAYLHQNNLSLPDWDAMDDAIEGWIGGLNPGYFARDWRMVGTKRDQPIIKRAWSEAWAEFRITRDRLPRVERYNPGGRNG